MYLRQPYSEVNTKGLRKQTSPIENGANITRSKQLGSSRLGGCCLYWLGFFCSWGEVQENFFYEAHFNRMKVKLHFLRPKMTENAGSIRGLKSHEKP